MPSVPLNNIVCFGEAYCFTSSGEKQFCGLPVSVAYHLKKLGKTPVVLSRIGFDENGKELIQFLEHNSISTDYFQVDYVHETGKAQAIKEKQQEVAGYSAWDFIEWESEYESLLKSAGYFVFSSLCCRSAISKSTVFRCLEICKSIVFAITILPAYYHEKTLRQLLHKTDILKLGTAELHLITGWFSNYKTDEERVLLLQEKFNINTIIVTRGHKGALLYTESEFYHHNGYVVKSADTSGCGGAFLAGFISVLIDRGPPGDMLDAANRLGALVASRNGCCPQYLLSELSAIPSFSSAKH